MVRKQPNRLDWAVYRLFRGWWNPILRNNPRMAFGLAVEIMKWLGAEIRYDDKLDEFTVSFMEKVNE